MEPKDWLAPAAALVGIFLSSWVNSRQAERRQLSDTRLECYAQWAAGIELRFSRYVHQTPGPYPEDSIMVIEKKLLMLEPDPELRRLINEIWDSMPHLLSNEFQDLHQEAMCEPDWKWPPFEEKMAELITRVHASRHSPWWRFWRR